MSLSQTRSWLAVALAVPAIAMARPGNDPVIIESGIVPPFAADPVLLPITASAPAATPAVAAAATETPTESTIDKALAMIGIPYRWGGDSPEEGFDCSGFVQHVYQQTRDLVLPHSARAQAREGEKVDKQSLSPGDLVFFNTMRRAFSHVGIYLGDGLFVHAPRKGANIRVDSMQAGYWRKRYNGARRVARD